MDLDRHILRMIFDRVHLRGLGETEKGEGHDRPLAAHVAVERAVQYKEIALRRGHPGPFLHLIGKSTNARCCHRTQIGSEA